MTESFSTFATAAWFGLLTAISPCPLASSIASVAYVTGASRGAGGGGAMVSGLAYAAGRGLAYVLLAGLVTWGLLSVPAAAGFLQAHMGRVLGFALIVVGLFILMNGPWPRGERGGWMPFAKFVRPGPLGAAILGFACALSFCPISAGLFFGSLLPLGLAAHAPVSVPAAYAAGTALPVVAASMALAAGAGAASRFFNRAQTVERWLRRLTGGALVAVGGYLLWSSLG